MFIKLYFIALPVFLAIDALWLGLVAKNFYKDQIGFLMKAEINWLSTVVFYLIFIAGLVFFVVLPALEKNSWSYALLAGILFGLVTYATYDLTNMATIKDWPVLVTVVDLFWGMFIAGSVSIITFLIANKINL
jgi:uncharacterized membrane protein